jgi:hypothetical protein
MHAEPPIPPVASRRQFLVDGLARLAAAGLLLDEGRARPAGAETPAGPHFTPRCRRVIQLFMAGGPSHLDLFDPKPELAARDGQTIPDSFIKDQRYAFLQPGSKLMAPRFPFARHGQSGAELADVLPHLARVADHIAIVRSVHTDQFNHAPAQIFFHTGGAQPGRPSIGAWTCHGLGSASQDLPAYVVMSSGGGISGGMANWSSGFLPTRLAGVVLRGQGDAILDVSSPKGFDPQLQRASIDLVQALNRRSFLRLSDPEIESRIAAYELAWRMQSAAPELMDLGQESDATLSLYGADRGKPSFARNCLLARRLVERGVRYVQLFHEAWDHHSDVEDGLRTQCRATDQGSAALVLDLARRGLLDDTLVLWGGEFGRTPMTESHAALGRGRGRDHHPNAFTVWLAGGGIRPGITLGATDDFGFRPVADPVHVHDLQATVLHLLGFDHERLTYRFQGRDFRLTDVAGTVVKRLLA